MSARQSNSGSDRIAGRRVPSAVLLASLAGVLGGCEADSFLDPSVIGRWEKTPTVVPILERIDVIERDTGEFVDVTPVMPDDLLPEASEYRVGPGDGIVITILDFYEAGRETQFEQFVDVRGYLVIPQLGEIYVTKLTRPEIEKAIAQAVRDAGILEDPLVDVQVPGARQATFSIFGLVDRVGRYAVPAPDYRLLEALTDAGGVSPSIEKIYIIRQVALTDVPGPGDAAAPGEKPGEQEPPPKPAPSRGKPGEEGVDLIDLIEELTEPETKPGEEPAVPPPAEEKSPPETMSDELESALEPEESPAPNPSVMGSPGTSRQAGARAGANPSASKVRRPANDRVAPAALRQEAEPPIDLVDTDPPLTPPQSLAGRESSGVAGSGRWVFLNGEWVRVVTAGTGTDGEGLPENADPLTEAPKGTDIVTQRVIEVPVSPLIQGVAQYNLVVRAGDAISVPGPQQGFVYLAGPGVARPGVYQIPFTGKLTLQRLIASAGGLSAIAIPERCDLIRMVGDDRQATIRLNLRAISEGTQPDLFLKPDDLVNVGTNFWATPLAVFRGGLRASYGFGFLLDRNFGNDVFGAPPEQNPFN